MVIARRPCVRRRLVYRFSVGEVGEAESDAVVDGLEPRWRRAVVSREAVRVEDDVAQHVPVRRVHRRAVNWRPLREDELVTRVVARVVDGAIHELVSRGLRARTEHGVHELPGTRGLLLPIQAPL